jgi:hypothetical protein
MEKLKTYVIVPWLRSHLKPFHLKYAIVSLIILGILANTMDLIQEQCLRSRMELLIIVSRTQLASGFIKILFFFQIFLHFSLSQLMDITLLHPHLRNQITMENTK